MIEPRPEDTFEVGQVLNNTWEIEGILGRGGTSEVYRARNVVNSRVSALKVLNSRYSANSDFLVLMNREEEMRDIRHPAVVRYSENNRTADGHVYLVMDFIDGPALSDLMNSGPIPADQLLVIVQRVAEGLVATHEHGVVHRDLSPDNIILRGGNPAEAVIIDFGIAKDTKPDAETIVGNEFAGKYQYAAPEQLSGQADARADIYALGATVLAAFRGKAPEVGRNPMEVVQNKSKPLDTEGVPEPLRTVIDAMTRTGVAERIQTATDVILLINPEYQSDRFGRTRTPVPPVAPPMSDATVIVAAPPSSTSQTPSEPPSAPPASILDAVPEAIPEPVPMPETIRSSTPPPPPVEPGGGSGRLIWVLLVLVVLAGGGTGAFLAGVFDPFLKPSADVASPYTLRAEQVAGETPALSGHAQSDEAAQRLKNAFPGNAEVKIASGAPTPSFADDMIWYLGTLSRLDAWQLDVSDTSVTIQGETDDRALYDAATQVLTGPQAPTGYVVSVDITLGKSRLPVADVQAILTELENCGSLEINRPAGDFFGPNDPILVTGLMAEVRDRSRLFDSLKAIAGERQLTLDVVTLNSPLCVARTALPEAPNGSADLAFSYGGSGAPNESNIFKTDENPVIDVRMPATETRGSLWVILVDVGGAVFHLLPNNDNPESDLESLGVIENDSRRIRVTWSLEARNEDPKRLAFKVGPPYGKSEIIVFHTSKPLFDTLRPQGESIEGFARGLSDRLRDSDVEIYGLRHFVIVSEEQ